MNIIKVNVNFKERYLDADSTTLTTGDFNSTKMIFRFDKEGKKVFEMKTPSGKVCLAKEIVDNELILGEYTTVFSEEGRYIYEISLIGEGSKLSSASGSLFIRKEQVVISDDISKVKLPIFDELITDLERLNLRVEKAEEGVNIIYTSKKGLKEIYKLSGAKGDKGDRGLTGAKGDKGDKGDTYTITEADYQEIANLVLANYVDGDSEAY